MKRVIAVANQKGGARPATTAVNLAASLAGDAAARAAGRPRSAGNATMGCGVEKNQLERGVGGVLVGGSTVAEARSCRYRRSAWRCCPRTRTRPAEGAAPDHDGRPRDAAALALKPVRDQYDVILIGAAAGAEHADRQRAGRRRQRAGAADAVRVLRARGLSALVGTIEQIRASVNPDLEIEGVRTMFDPRNNLANEVRRSCSRPFGDKVFHHHPLARTGSPRRPLGKPALLTTRIRAARSPHRARRRDDPPRGRGSAGGGRGNQRGDDLRPPRRRRPGGLHGAPVSAPAPTWPPSAPGTAAPAPGDEGPDAGMIIEPRQVGDARWRWTQLCVRLIARGLGYWLGWLLLVCPWMFTGQRPAGRRYVGADRVLRQHPDRRQARPTERTSSSLRVRMLKRHAIRITCCSAVISIAGAIIWAPAGSASRCAVVDGALPDRNLVTEPVGQLVPWRCARSSFTGGGAGAAHRPQHPVDPFFQFPHDVARPAVPRRLGSARSAQILNLPAILAIGLMFTSVAGAVVAATAAAAGAGALLFLGALTGRRVPRDLPRHPDNRLQTTPAPRCPRRPPDAGSPSWKALRPRRCASSARPARSTSAGSCGCATNSASSTSARDWGAASSAPPTRPAFCASIPTAGAGAGRRRLRAVGSNSIQPLLAARERRLRPTAGRMRTRRRRAVMDWPGDATTATPAWRCAFMALVRRWCEAHADAAAIAASGRGLEPAMRGGSMRCRAATGFVRDQARSVHVGRICSASRPTVIG